MRIVVIYVIFLTNLLYAQSAIRITYLATWGEQGQGPGQFQSPRGISISPIGDLYIADTGNQRIQKLDSRGRFLTEIGGFGWQAEQFDRPLGIYAMNGLDVFVADYNNHRIQRFDKDLHFLALFQSSENWPEYLQFGFPLDVALSTQGELLCLDGENFRILKLDVYGNPQRCFGDFNAGVGRLIRPQRLLITQDQRVLVSDDGSGTIFIFDSHGNYLNRWGKSILKSPQDMAELPENHILVADAEAGILIFNASGQLVVQLRGSPEGGFNFKEVVDVATFDHRIFILDSQRHAVDVFRCDISSQGGF